MGPKFQFVTLGFRETRLFWGRALAQALDAGFPPRPQGHYPTSSDVGFVVDKVAMGQVSSKYCCFPYQFSFQQLLHNRAFIP
jgi:hypothetical protein